MRNKTKLSLIFSTVLLGFLWAAPVGSAVVQDGGVEVEAHAKGPMGMKIEAKTGMGKIEDDGVTTTLSVPVVSLRTGIELRDRHMRELLEAGVFKDITLQVKDSDIVVPGVDDTIRRDVVGVLRIRGVESKVVLRYDAVKDCEGHVGVLGSFTVRMDEFGIRPPSYAGITVKNEVWVVARFRLKDI